VKNGVLYVVFGEDYDKVASVCAGHSRKNTKLPFHILADHDKTHRWKGISDVTWKNLNLPQKENRRAKLRAPWHTPFDRTLYLDCDAIIQNPGIDLIFEMLRNNDVVFFRCYRWEKGDKILRIYKRAMKMFKCSMPIDIWQGGIVGFNRNVRVSAFYSAWAEYWHKFGRQREMPCLACAAQKVPMKAGVLPPRFFAYESGMNPKSVVQHHVGGSFMKKFGVPKWEKKAAMCSKGDFNWVTWK